MRMCMPMFKSLLYLGQSQPAAECKQRWLIGMVQEFDGGTGDFLGGVVRAVQDGRGILLIERKRGKQGDTRSKDTMFIAASSPGPRVCRHLRVRGAGGDRRCTRSTSASRCEHKGAVIYCVNGHMKAKIWP